MSALPSIAVIGGGFAGTMLAVQLAKHAPSPLRVTLYDRSGAFARGVAYSTRNPLHLLNVPAARMGAFPDKIDHFHQWLHANGHEAAPNDFMPRMMYGDYIESLFAEARNNSRGIIIETRQAEVTDVMAAADGVTLTLADGTRHKADLLALAIGSLAVHQPRFAKPLVNAERYTGNVWAPMQGSILTRSQFSADDSPVLIIGTGLTMIDMVLSLRSQGYEGVITAVSRHGLLPQPHSFPAQAHERFLHPETSPRTAFSLLRAIRIPAKKHDWRAVLDSLRADTPALWARLPEAERKKLTRVLAYWNTHRHRMPQQSARTLDEEMNSGTFKLLAGHVLQIEEAEQGLSVTVRRGGETIRIQAAHVLNCAGPATNILHSGSALLDSLLKKNLIESGPLNWGIAAETDGRARGANAGRIFALGPLLTGERLETVAVPELRVQAETAARSIISSLRAATVSTASG